MSFLLAFSLALPTPADNAAHVLATDNVDYMRAKARASAHARERALLAASAAMPTPIAPTADKAASITPTAHKAAFTFSSIDPALPAAAMACSYRNSNALFLLAGDIEGTCSVLTSAGWTLSESYNLYHETIDDTDNLDVQTNADGDCLLAFPGADMYEFFVGNYNASRFLPTTYYGVDNVMVAMAEELEFLLDAIREKHGSLGSWASTVCPGKMYIAGHSMGGGMGHLLAHLANLYRDPLGIAKPISGLYLYSADGPGYVPLVNERSADGCYPGKAYYNRVPDGVDPGYSAYADANFISYAESYTGLGVLDFSSLDMVGEPTTSSNLLGPGELTACGRMPSVFASMLSNATLASHAANNLLLSFGSPFGLHEPIAYAYGVSAAMARK